MLKVNQLSGFGGAAPAILIATGSDLNTNTPSFTVNLGPPGTKQVLCAFACSDSDGSDPWTWGTGSVGGEAFTYVLPGGEEQAGNGSNFTGGATIRALQTELSGDQTITIPIAGFSGVMNANRLLAIVVRGFSTTPVSVDNGDNQGGSNGDDVTLNTAGARIVLCAAAASTSPGDFQGPGAEVTALSGSQLALGYDLAPAGGAADVYSFTATKYVIAGAAFG